MKTIAIIGAGISGLISARIASSFAEKVVLIDRDFLGVSGPRRGVPQSSHLHLMMLKGRQLVEELFPGFDADLASAGAPDIDWGVDSAWLSRFGWFPRTRSGICTRGCSRDLLEKTIRERVLNIKNVDVIEKGSVQKLIIEKSKRRHIVQSIQGSFGKLSADLVINTSGRTGLVYQVKRTQEIDASLGYASCLMEVPQSALKGFKQLYIQMRPPQLLRGGIMVPLENGLYMVTLVGAGRDYPSAQEKGFLQFAKSLPDSLFYEVISQSRFASPIRTYKKTAGFMGCMEPGKTPANLVMLGDALCSFNPVYGQGMTVAALSAFELRSSLEKGTLDSIHNRIISHARVPWCFASSEDLRVPRVRTHGFGQTERLVFKGTRFITDTVMKKAVMNDQIYHRFLRVMHMIDGPHALLPLVIHRGSNESGALSSFFSRIYGWQSQ
jgi:2-polyprenyl-6-methoxyphenol hydroxylase-like FAD-dependent oxidoreductase